MLIYVRVLKLSLDTAHFLCQDKNMKQKRTKAQKRSAIHKTLELHRRFDIDYVPCGDNWTMPDENYKYRQNLFNRIITGFWRTFTFIFGPVLLKLVYGYRVTGRENLKKIKGAGAISVCNHISFLDTLFIRQAVGHYRSYHTIAHTNNKKGLGGHILRHGGTLPFSSNYTANKNLVAEIGRLLKKGKIINIYAEKAMWLGYQKPRPMKPGAFFYSVRFNAPVLPVFCTFDLNGKGRIKKLKINILPPVYPDLSLPTKQRLASLKDAVEAEWKSCYERAYGVPLAYEMREERLPAP